MKTAFSKSICSLASLLLALTLTLSCSGGDDDDNGPTGNSEYERWQESLKYIDPDDPTERCGSNGIAERKCDVNGSITWYNPLNYSCRRMGSNCDENDNCTYTYALLTIALCGNEPYIDHPDYGKCVGGVLQRKCGDVWYNRETQYCDYEYNPNTNEETRTVKAKERCGNKYYEPDYSTSMGSDGVIVREPNTRCQNEVIVERCGWGENVTWYNSETQYCSFDPTSMTTIVKPRVLCGSEYIEPDYERCNNGVVESKCGGGGLVPGGEQPVEPVWYNYITQTCVESGNWQTGYTYTVRNKVRCGS